MTSHKHTNKLIHETSPYLLQHAHNPVHWYPWSEEALNKAKQEDKIILVSIGYSACHWCHVMERESFENEHTAAIMNDHFINIKIDREERPDLDHIYMDAVQAISGSGGWPLNVFLTPDAKPFYGGTYFPPVRAFNRASWREVLGSITSAWKEKRHEIEAQAENLTDHIKNSGDFSSRINLSEGIQTAQLHFENCHSIFELLMKNADTEWGGFGRAPKFPQTFIIQYLLEYHFYTQNKEALQQALLSIDKMLEGGIYDHVGGGLARYSTDNEWLAPHFEKMLYDNALLLMVLCDAFQITRDDKYKTAIDKTISFIRAELMNAEGGFYAAIDADSEGEEGKYYVWDKAEIVEILMEKATDFCAFFDVSDNGNWEGKNILRILKPADQFAAANNTDSAGFKKFIAECLQQLRKERDKRERPLLDDKSICSWNALMVKALSKAAVVFQKEEYKSLAIAAYKFIDNNFAAGTPGQLQHTWKQGKAKHPGFMDDYACLADACISLYECCFDESYLHKARLLCEYAVENFSDADKVMFYYTNQHQSDVIARKKEVYDGATPSANAVMASNLYRLSVIFDISEWRQRTDTMLAVMLPALSKYPSSFSVWAALYMQKVKGLKEIVVLGNDAYRLACDLNSAYFLPGKILMASEKKVSIFPLMVNKKITNPALIYLCQDYICHSPLTRIEDVYHKIRESGDK